jgi:hypothetical protein
MDKTAYKLATSQIGTLDGDIRLGNDLISLDEGRRMVQSFLGERPRYPIDVALKLKEIGGYFRKSLADYHKERN